jgi:hypothetical protein
MRTTLTLEPDVARMLEEETHRARKPFKQVVNEALRRGLAGRGRESASRYRVQVHHAELAPGIDRAGFNRLADELDDAATLAKVGR